MAWGHPTVGLFPYVSARPHEVHTEERLGRGSNAVELVIVKVVRGVDCVVGLKSRNSILFVFSFLRRFTWFMEPISQKKIFSFRICHVCAVTDENRNILYKPLSR